MKAESGNIAGLILAAGASRRMGTPKALLELGGRTFLEHLVRAMTGSCEPVVVVLGHDAARIRGAAPDATEVVFVVNPDPDRGQLSSLQCGLGALPPSVDGVIYTPVDYPGIRPSTVAALAAAFRRREPGQWLVVPRHGGTRGHPVCASREAIAELLALPPSSQAREVVERRRAQTAYVDVDDPGILRDTDDPESYRRLVGSWREAG
jgi:CTP:molybdopterin cytidylyltransferase MocA